MSEQIDANPSEKGKYIPPLRFHWLTPLYDGVLQLLMRENRLRSEIVEAMMPGPSDKVLDFGSGTGTLSVRLKKVCAEAELVGLDIDEATLAIARRKAKKADVDISYCQGDIAGPLDGVQFTAGSFDHIVSSLVFHHLTRQQKKAALDNAFRLLKPGRRFLLVDWGKPENLLQRLVFLPVQMLDGFETTSDNVEGVLPALMNEAGFEDVAELRRLNTLLGVVSFFRGVKPSEH